MTHRLRVDAKRVKEEPTLLFEAVKKISLSALYIPEAKRILIDEGVPKPKHRWIEAHEIAHSLIEWHSEFSFGDNKLSSICSFIVPKLLV